MARPVLTLAASAVATWVLLATLWSPAAGADPPRPTNFESRVLTVEPPARAVTVEVVGGDAFLALTVARGHTVTVPDYGDDGSEYLRVLTDGTVQVNETSAAHEANDGRYGSGATRDAPDDGADVGAGDADDEPRWVTVATDGRHAWHDHRIHLMVPDHLAVVDARGRVDLGGDDGTWTVPLVVDGTDTVVRGELVRHPAPWGWPWWLLAAVTAGLVAAGAGFPVGWRPAGLVLGVGLLVVAAAATGLSVAVYAAAPPGAGATVSAMVLAGTAGLAAAAVVTVQGVATRKGLSAQRVGGITRTGLAAGASTLGWWAVARRAVWTHAVIPSGLPVLDRATTALALGVALGAAVVLVARPEALTSPASA